MSAARPKPVRCWVIVNPWGSLLQHTVGSTRQYSISQFMRGPYPDREWKDISAQLGLRIIRCTLVPEQADAA